MEFPAWEWEGDTGHQVSHSQCARLALVAPWAQPTHASPSHVDGHLQGRYSSGLANEERGKGRRMEGGGQRRKEEGLGEGKRDGGREGEVLKKWVYYGMPLQQQQQLTTLLGPDLASEIAGAGCSSFQNSQAPVLY